MGVHLTRVPMACSRPAAYVMCVCVCHWTECHVQGWLDDRVECRNALSKLYKLAAVGYMDHTEVPWCMKGEREPRYWEWGKK